MSNAERAAAVALVLDDSEISRIFSELLENYRAVHIGKAERDRDLEDRLGVGVYRIVDEAFPKAALRDGFEISRHLFDEAVRRLELDPAR